MSYPTDLDNFVNNNPTDFLVDMASIGLTGMLSLLNSGAGALEAKIGTGASTPTANKVLRSSGTGTSVWGQVTNNDIIGAAGIPKSKLNLVSSIVNADLDGAAAIAYSKLAALTSAHILVGSGSNVATDTAVTGDVTISNTGVTAIGAAKVLNTMLSTTAITIGYAEVTSDQGSITTEADLANLTITVTVPAGGRRIMVMGRIGVESTVSDDGTRLRIKEDTTVLSSGNSLCRVIVADGTVFWSGTPTAGSHTYKLTLARTDGIGTITMKADTTRPAFILAQLI